MAKKTVKKAAKPAASPKKSKADSVKPKKTSASKARVRMYRQGLGDCLLLSFNLKADGSGQHVLIDCGTLGNSANPGVTLDKVLEDVRVTTGGRLDLLITTHEHKDHLSGFNSEREVFIEKRIEVARVWQAWTENPDDDDAKTVRKYKGDLGRAVAAMLAEPGVSAAVPEAGDLLGFFGDDHALGAGKFAKTINEAMEFVRTGLDADVTYYEPPDTAKASLEFAWLPGWRVYVLGPPRDRAAIGDTGEKGSDQLYGLAVGGWVPRAVLARGAALDPATRDAAPPVDDMNADDPETPFDVRFRQPIAGAATHYPEYSAESNAWRKIDNDYLQPVSDLALQLDSLTNNTSLALAFEHTSSKKVLLFPADAQQGNWLSWQKLRWTVDGKTITVDDLLARTVFYKAGHHGSHNATAKGKGLELMKKQDELVTFVPVDRVIALGRNPKGSWAMPAVLLYRRLLEKCQGRVLRSDTGWAAPFTAGDTEDAFKGLASKEEWDEWDANQKAAVNVTETELYFQFELK